MKRMLLMALLASCGESSKPKTRALSQPHADLTSALGQAIVAKDYSAAYALMAESYKQSTSLDDFKTAISHYRDRVEGKVTFTMETGESDPAKIKEDVLVRMFIQDAAKRDSIVEEPILHFDAGEVEGWSMILWIVSEGGQFRFLSFAQDD